MTYLVKYLPRPEEHFKICRGLKCGDVWTAFKKLEEERSTSNTEVRVSPKITQKKGK